MSDSTSEASAPSGLAPATADARGLDGIRALVPVGEFYSCTDPEVLSHTEFEEALEEYLDDRAERDCDMAALIREHSPVTVKAYRPMEIKDEQIEAWADSMLESLGEHWSEYANPEEDPCSLFPGDAEKIMREAVRTIVRGSRVWACDEVGEVDLSAEQVETVMRDFRSDWFEDAAPRTVAVQPEANPLAATEPSDPRLLKTGGEP